MGALESFPRITPLLWFDSNADEAVNFYTSIFKNSRRLEEYPPGGQHGSERQHSHHRIRA